MNDYSSLPRPHWIIRARLWWRWTDKSGLAIAAFWLITSVWLFWRAIELLCA